MPRTKADPVTRAFEAWLALSDDEKTLFDARVTGYMRAGAPAKPLPPRKRAPKKPGGENAT